MAKQLIGVGSAANDGTGDPLRSAFSKANANFSELYNKILTAAALAGGTLTLTLADGTVFNVAVPAPPSPATSAPLPPGTPAVGTSLLYARQDHVHALPAATNIKLGGVIVPANNGLAVDIAGNLLLLTNQLVSFNASFAVPVVNSRIYSVDASTASVAMALPAISSLPSGISFTVAAKKTDPTSNSLTFQCQGTDSIEQLNVSPITFGASLSWTTQATIAVVADVPNGRWLII